MQTTEKSTSVITRWLKVSFVLSKYFVFYRLGKHKKDIFGKRLCFACEDLGPIFVKLGQILSTRYDLLNNEDCKELQRLLDEVSPLSFETIEAIIEKDFGKKLNYIFRDFEKVPIASASISQVHKARLLGGEEVAVKVRRPGIQTTIESDIRVLKQVISVAEHFSDDLKHLDAKQIISQLHDWILQEVNFRQEAKNIVRMKNYYIYAMEKTNTPKEEYEQLIFPKVYEKYCGDNVVTMEFVHGVPFSKFDTIKDLQKYDVEKSAKVCAMLNLRYWLVNQKDEFIFHADPHAANVLLLPHGKLGLIDFGLIGVLSAKEARQTADLFLAVYARNLEKAITCALAVSNASYEKYAPIIRADVTEYLRKARDSSIGFWFMDFIRIFVKHKVPIPFNLVLLGRQNAVVDGLIATILPGKTTLDLMGDELEQALRKKIVQNVLDTDFSRLAYAVSEEIKESPDKIVSIIDQLSKDPYKIVRDFHEANT